MFVRYHRGLATRIFLVILLSKRTNLNLVIDSKKNLAYNLIHYTALPV